MNYSVFNFKMMGKALVRKNYTTVFLSMLILGTLSFSFWMFQNVIIDVDAMSSGAKILMNVVSVACTLLMSPAVVGVASVFTDITDGKPTKPTNTFLWYGEGKKFKRSVAVSVYELLISAVWAIIFGTIVFGAAYFIAPSIFQNLSSTDSMVAAYALMNVYYLALFVMALVFVMVSVYTAASFILAADCEKTGMECIKLSRKIMKSRRWKLIGLQCIFILQLVGYSIVTATVCTLIAGGNADLAITSATIVTALIAAFDIIPQYYMTMVLYTKDAMVGNQ